MVVGQGQVTSKRSASIEASQSTAHSLRNSSGILRSILWDGTIINQAPPEVLEKLGHATASIGLVADDPVASANDAAQFLRSRGFEAKVVLDVEPELPIAFLVTNATSGTVLNFRRHMIHLPRPQPVRTSRG